MNKHSAKTILFVAILSFGMIYATSRAAYAHNFSSDESASYLAKVQEIQVEAHLVQSDLGNVTSLQWHVQRLGSYWTFNDIALMAERNQLLSKEIPGTIANITTQAMMHNSNASLVGQLVNNLGAFMNESVSARIDPPKLQNLTVSALAIKSVLDEVLNDYGNATGATMSLTNMSNMGSTSGMQMSNTSAIVNVGAYESSQAMTNASVKMWSTLKSNTPSNVSPTAISALDGGFAKLKQLINDKATPNQVTELVHGTIHPNFVLAYNLQEQGMAGMKSGGGNNMIMNGTMGANMTMTVHVPHALMMYVNQSGDEIHNFHKALASSNNGDYKTDTKYTLAASGSAMSLSSSSMTSDAKISLDLSTWKAEGRVVTMDVMGGTVTVGQTSMTVHSGVVVYIINGHVIHAVAVITPADNPGSNSLQILKIRGVLPQDNNKLPLSASDQPLNISAQTMTLLSPGWVLNLNGQIALSS